MDEMRISSKFLQSIISKIIKKTLGKKLGISPEVEFGAPIEVKIDGDTARIHIDISANVSTDDLMKLLKDLV